MTTTSARDRARRRRGSPRAGSRPARAPAPASSRQPVGAEPDLVGRLLAAGVEHGAARRPRAAPRPAAAAWTCRCPARRRSRIIEPGHDPAAQHEVELVDARCASGASGAVATSRRRVGGATRRSDGRRRASCRLPPGRPTRHRLLRHRVPRPARLAAARPTWGARAPHRCSGRRTGLGRQAMACDIGRAFRSPGSAEVVEAGVLLVELELHVAGGSVAVLASMTSASPRLRSRPPGRSNLGPVDEDDQVGVLLDGARVAQVGEDRLALAAALLGGAGELRERDDRDLAAPAPAP